MKIEYNKLGNKDIADFLIVTATDIETNSLLKAFKPVCKDGLLQITNNDRIYTAGIYGGYNVIHCQCKNMGTQEVGSSMMTTVNALTDWPCIKGVIMVGIAFGMYNEEHDIKKQHFGDVLIATKIFPYENQRLNKDGSIKYRGKEHCVDENFLDAFTIISREWKEHNLYEEETCIELCPLLTGEKLVDNIEKRNELKRLYPEYRGGEMEGMGIASASEDKKKPWILIKSICDFADGKKGSSPDEEGLKIRKQIAAANSAVKACDIALTKINVQNIVTKRTNFFYRSEIINLDQVFFLCYDTNCQCYYLLRSIDAEMQKHILTKSIWVSGDTGIGKSELLRHTLIENDVLFIYVDLSLCDRCDIDSMFVAIYEEACEKLGLCPEDCGDYKETIKKLCKLFEDKSQTTPIYIFIEELPFEENSNEFRLFVQKFIGLLIYSNAHMKKTKLLFVLSSIAMPTEAIDIYREKVHSMIHFVELQQWTMDECLLLVNLLCSIVDLAWSKDYSKEQFISDMKFSPRLIKSFLKTCCSLDYAYIDKRIVEKLKLQ